MLIYCKINLHDKLCHMLAVMRIYPNWWTPSSLFWGKIVFSGVRAYVCVCVEFFIWWFGIIHEESRKYANHE